MRIYYTCFKFDERQTAQGRVLKVSGVLNGRPKDARARMNLPSGGRLFFLAGKFIVGAQKESAPLQVEYLENIY